MGKYRKLLNVVFHFPENYTYHLPQQTELYGTYGISINAML
ncbi:MAG: hypothetical protein SNJ77_10890 [Cytophagales bacterium]